MRTLQQYIMIVVFLLLVVSAVFLIKELRPFERQRPSVGEPVPEISLADQSGSAVRLADLRGKVVLLNFWAGWCPPCKEEMPGIQRTYLEYRDRGFAVIAISIDRVDPLLIKDLGVSFPVVKATEATNRDFGSIDQIPQSFLVARDGKILKKVKGIYDEQDLRRDVEAALRGEG